jgi:integrase
VKTHLTRRAAEAARPDPNRREYYLWDDEVRGFGLRVGASGTKTWVFQAAAGGAAPRRMSLGPYPAVEPGAARARAAAARGAIAAGADPFTAGAKPSQKKKIVTLAEFIPLYLAHAKGHKRSWAKDEKELTRYLPPEWKARPLDSFTPTDMVSLHTTLGGRGHYVANGFLRLLRSMFNRARDWGHLPEAALNPCRKVEWFKEHPRERFLTLDELDRLMAALDAEETEPLWRHYFLLCLLTSQRRSEVAGMRWDELDLDAAVWTIPASRTKAARATRVPLTAQVLETLRTRRAQGEFVFPSPRVRGAPIREPKGAWQKILVRAGMRPGDVRIHDLRRTGGSYLAAAGVGLPLIGKLLNHSRPETTAIYSRLDLEPVRAAQQQLHDRLAARRNGAQEQSSVFTYADARNKLVH